MRRVVHLVHNFPPEFRGGTESYLARLLPLQQAHGLAVTVICGSETRRDGGAAREEFGGIAVHRVFRRADEPFGVDFRPAQPAREVAALVAALAPDLLHVHHWFNLGDALLATLPPIPAVVTLHDSYAACPRFFFLRPDGGFCGDDLPVPLERCVACVQVDDGGADLAGRLAARRTRFAAELARARFVLAPSEVHGALLVRAGLVPAAQLRVLPLGLAPDEIAQAIAARRATGPRADATGPLRLVSFGNLSVLKGIDLLLDAVRAVAPRPVTLDLFGEVAAADRARLHAAAAGLPVTWHGRYEPATLAAAAPAFDLAVFPSRAHETYSLVVEEAFAFGLPVVVSDRGAPARRVAAGGRVIAVADAAPLAATLAELADRRAVLAALRRNVPAPDSLADHALRLQALYDAALPEPRP